MQDLNPQLPYTTPKPPKRTGGEHNSVLSTIGIVIAAFAVAAFVMTFIFRSYQVDGPSMEPTLHNNDRLIIWKLGHTIGKITGNTYIPNRGDIIVFSEQALIAEDGSSKQLIKRVIALPGERVVIKNGIVQVFNAESPQGFIPDTTLPYGENIDLRVDPQEEVDLVVGTDEVYALGDNRDNSLDSRTFGPIPAKDIVGKLILRVYPLADAERF